jgi:hypothetical protein
MIEIIGLFVQHPLRILALVAMYAAIARELLLLSPVILY